MALGKDYEGQDCALARALEVVGERWTLLIVRDAFYGVRRFTAFLAHLDIPRAVLAARLQTLVDAGVLAKQGHDYTLTAMGLELWPIVHSMARWGDRHFGAEAGPTRLFVHADCGTRLEPGSDCPECGVTVPAGGVEILPGPGQTGRRDDPVTVALRVPHRMLEPIAT